MNKGCQAQIIIQHHKQSVQPFKNLTRDLRKVQFLEAISYQRISDRDPVTGFLSSVQFIYTISSPLFTSKYSPDIEVSLKLMFQKKKFFPRAQTDRIPRNISFLISECKSALDSLFSGTGKRILSRRQKITAWSNVNQGSSGRRRPRRPWCLSPLFPSL